MYAFEKILDSAIEGYAIIGLDRKIKWCNRSFSCIFACRKEDLIGKDVVDMCYSHKTEIADHILQEMIDGAISNVRFEREFVRLDGKTIWGKICASIIRNEQEIPSFLFIHLEDTTKCRKNMDLLRDTVSGIVAFLKEK